MIRPYVRYACLASRQCYVPTTRIQCCVPSTRAVRPVPTLSSPLRGAGCVDGSYRPARTVPRPDPPTGLFLPTRPVTQPRYLCPPAHGTRSVPIPRRTRSTPHRHPRDHHRVNPVPTPDQPSPVHTNHSLHSERGLIYLSILSRLGGALRLALEEGVEFGAGVGEALVRREAVPPPRRRVVLRPAVPVLVHVPEVDLRFG